MRFSTFSSVVSFSTALRASSSRAPLLRPPARPQVLRTRTNPPFVRANSSVSLHNLAPNEGSTKERRRVGRGVGSKKGGHTTGRGHKGQKSRSGKRLPYVGFEGGQLPLYRKIPKKGNANPLKRSYAPLNINRLQDWIRQGRIDPTQPITVRTVVKSNLIHGLGKHSGVKLLGNIDPDMDMPKVDLHLNKFSPQAGAAIIKAGGSCTAVYHNRLSMEQELRPHKFIGREITPARPVRRADIMYYTDPTKFGYLADQKEQLFRDRGFDPTIKRSRIAGQPYRDTRGLSPEEAAVADAAMAKKRMDEVLEIEKLRI